MKSTKQSLRVNELAGLGLVGLLILATAGWAANTELSGAVIASGVVVAKDDSKEVQHVEGGIIREIYVTEGQSVDAGAIVARLDHTQIKAKLGIIEGQLIELGAEQARLEAERDDAEKVGSFDAPSEHAASGATERAIDGQWKHLTSVRETISKKKDQLREQTLQIEAAISGTEAKLAATEKQIELAEAELGVLRSLMERGLTTRNRIFSMERELASLKGQAEDLKSNVSAQKGRMAELQIKLLELDDQRRTDVTGRLTEVRAKLADLHEQRSFEMFRLRGTEIVAPTSGRVHNLRIHTAGGVTGAGATLMTIVPSEEAMVFRVRVRPQDIDRLYVGQSARLRITAFSARTTPEIAGTVAVIGADQSVDSVTGAAYFRVELAAAPEAFAGIDQKKIKPGVPVEAFITTDQQTVLTYLFKPLTDQFAKAFREM